MRVNINIKGETNGSLVENKAGKETVNGQSSKEVIFGELLWVKLHEASWWPGQVVDENSVSAVNKPSSKRSNSDVLVRLYGSYIYKYVDIHRSRAEFKNILIENNFNHKDILKKSLEQDLPSLNSSSSRRRQQSKSKGIVVTEACDNGSSEKDVSARSQAKVSSKKRKQEKVKTAESHPETAEVKTKNKRLTPDGVLHDPEASTPNIGKVSSKKRKQEKVKTAESHPEMPELKTKNKIPTDGVHHDFEASTPNIVTLRPQELSARRLKVMQSLGLVAPSGSPFPRNRLVSPSPTVLN